MRNLLVKLIVFLFLLICIKVDVNADYAYEEEGPSFESYGMVCIIGIDGGGSFFSKTETPIFDEVFSTGSVTYAMKSMRPTKSAENWGSMIYGVSPEDHGINNFFAKYSSFSSNILHSIFWYAHDAYPLSECVSIVGWTPINTGIIESQEGILLYPGNTEQTSLSGEEVVRTFDFVVSQNKSPIKLAFLQIDEVDQAGHKFGWGSLEFYRAIKHADYLIGEIYKVLLKNNMLDDTLLIFTTDHGGINKSHGGNSEEEEMTTFAITGKNVMEHGEIKNMEVQDIGAVVLAALGIDIPSYYTGRVPVGIWNNYGSEIRKGSVFIKQENAVRRMHENISPLKIQNDKSFESVKYYNSFDEELTAGIFGNCLDCSEKYCDTNITWKDFETEEISFAFWIKTSGIEGDPSIFANKRWSSGESNGLIISHQPNNLRVNIADGHNRYDVDFPLPQDYSQGWTHYIICIDMRNRLIKGYCDFIKLYECTISDKVQIDILNREETIIIGQDISLNYKYPLNAFIDDVVIVDRYFSEDEVKELENTYFEPISTMNTSHLESICEGIK